LLKAVKIGLFLAEKCNFGMDHSRKDSSAY
jgi:hypothetical protein